MDPDAYKEINRRFAEVYGNNYLDILPVEYGYDGVHLTEASYRSVAEAVYDKLRELYGN
jgi:lysophospholipase L1-like esterase